MDETGRQELIAFGRQALEHVREMSYLPFSGTALEDSARDEIFSTLDAFEPAQAALTANRVLRERYGTESAWRLVLQFAYELMYLRDGPDRDQIAVESLWRS